MKRVVLAVGGTGGHVLPAMQIGHQMEAEGYQVTYMGFGLSGNRFFDKELHHYDVGTSWKAGIQISVRLLKRLQPTMVFGFGSFHSVPVLAAALWLRVPYYLFEFNVMPGRVNRLFAYGAKKVFVHFDVKRPLRGVIEKIDYPFAFPDVIPQKEAVHHFGLESHRKTLLVFGGSQGAEAINQLVLRSSPYLRDAFQVLHFPGKESLVKETYDTYGIPSYVEPFCHRMHLAWSAADLAICRAGAGALRDILLYETPAILIPYPQAKDQHQAHNADFIANIVGGGIHVPEISITPEALYQHLQRDFSPMKEAIRLFKEANPRPSFLERL